MINHYGDVVYTDKEAALMMYTNPNVNLSQLNILDPDLYNKAIGLFYLDLPKLTKYQSPTISVEEHDRLSQQTWFMPEEYKKLDIAQYVLDLCQTQEEKQRVGQELLEFQKRNLIDVLRFLKYWVDTMRENNLVWGVGRGSSVASYCLYLLGVHKVNSLTHKLDIKEFLK